MKYSVLVSIFVLAACGGGGSSGGGGGGAVVASTPFEGNYTGVEIVTTTAPDLPNTTAEYPLLINILGNGKVTITDVDNVQYTGELSGNTFTASGNQDGFILEDFPDASCSVEGVYSGTVSQGLINGTGDGSTTCEVGSISVSIPWEATFDVASAENAAVAPRSKARKSRVHEAIRIIQEET